jgi:hypothetical protein
MNSILQTYAIIVSLGLLAACAQTTTLKDDINPPLGDTIFVPPEQDSTTDIQIPEDLSNIEDVSTVEDILNDCSHDLPDYKIQDVSPEAPPVDTCVPGSGCFMEPCTFNSDCQSGWCVDHVGESVCTVACVQDECPNGWTCQQLSFPLPDVVYVCLSEFANLCRPCKSNQDCSLSEDIQDRCVPYGPQGNFCGSPCTTQEDCPVGYACQQFEMLDGSMSKQCLNANEVCSCNNHWIAILQATSCAVSNELGSCPGERVCSTFGLMPCDAYPPQEETCNGLDDDCDDEIDQGKLCDDANDCTEDSCDAESGCSYSPLFEGECQDGNPCTIADHCTEGVCVPGGSLTCSDDNPCTDDSCNPQDGCQNVPNQLACSDGNLCTEGDLCQGGVCQPGLVAIDCDDLNQCTKDACNPDAGCTHEALSGTACSDGNDCTQDICVNGSCQGTPLPQCCTLDADCDDNNPCTTDQCAEGDCFYAILADCCTIVADCNDGNPCTLDFCDLNSNTCIHDGTDCCTLDSECDDDQPCTLDVCIQNVCISETSDKCVTLKSVQDAWLEGSQNHGKENFLIVGKTGSYMKKRSVLKFDLSSIPADATVLSATFRVYHHYASVPSGVNEPGIDREVQVHRLLMTWNESQVTSEKADNSHSWSQSYISIGVDAEADPLDTDIWIFGEIGWKSFDVTVAADHWLKKPNENFGLLMWATNESTSGYDRRFHSKESAQMEFRPEVTIIYEELPP